MGKILIKFKVMHSLSFVLFAKRMAEAFWDTSDNYKVLPRNIQSYAQGTPASE